MLEYSAVTAIAQTEQRKSYFENFLSRLGFVADVEVKDPYLDT